MAKQIINIGAAPNDGTGDNIRTSFTKSNENFTELYDADNVPEAPNDGKQYGRQSEAWTEVTAMGDGDMKKSQYDSNNDGIVNNSHLLNSEAPSFYDQNAHVANTSVHLSADEKAALTGSPNTPTSQNTLATQADVAAAGGGDMSTGTYVTGTGDGSGGNAVDRARYADKSDYDNLENAPSTFPPSTHAHNDLYDTKLEVNEKIDDALENQTITVSDITDFTTEIGKYSNYNPISASAVVEVSKGYKVNASASAVTLTLPNPTDGQRIDFLLDDVTNTITLAPTSGTINGGASYQLSTLNSVYQAFYSSLKGEWFVITDTGQGGIGDAPDAVPRNRVAGAWVEDRLNSTRPTSGIVDQVWNPSLNSGDGGWQAAAYTASAVTSVNTQTGDVNLTTEDIPVANDKNYIGATDLAKIGANETAITTKQEFSLPDPAQTSSISVAYVTKSWYDANALLLAANTDYRLIDGGLETVEDKSGADYTLTVVDLGKVLYSIDDFVLPILSTPEGWFVTLVNKNSVGDITLDFSAVTVFNKIGTSLVISAGTEVKVRRGIGTNNYLIS